MKSASRFVLGLTGGIGSGKTEVLKEFSRLGARTIALDDIAREQALPGGAAFRLIVRGFGRGVLGSNGKINRGLLARLAFSSATVRNRLERLTHPLILKEMLRQIMAVSGIIIVDVPLLFEGGHEKRFDATMAVSASNALRLHRAAQRDGLSVFEVKKRIAAQISEQERVQRADIVIQNEDGLPQLRQKVREYWEALRLIHRR